MKHSWKTRGCYAVRTRKPHAPLGLPIIGRHWAYVGITSSRYHRDRQHAFGDSRYAASGQAAWSDLSPRWYSLPCLFPGSRWAREAQEYLWTWLLCPAYPVPKQPPYNFRKISRNAAQNQRWARDRRRARNPLRNLVVDILVTSVRLVIGLSAIGLLGWILWEMR